MLSWVVLWVVAAVIFLALDMIWLLWIGRGFYVDEIGGLLREQPLLPAAAAFYVLYVSGLVIMVIAPAQQAQSAWQAVLYGALFGLIAYGTYDLTNLSVMKGFTLRIALIDLAWGTVLSATAAGITVWLANRW